MAAIGFHAAHIRHAQIHQNSRPASPSAPAQPPGCQTERLTGITIMFRLAVDNAEAGPGKPRDASSAHQGTRMTRGSGILCRNYLHQRQHAQMQLALKYVF